MEMTTVFEDYAVFYIVCPFDHLASDISVLSVLQFTASDYTLWYLQALLPE
jgi:hypothetical protein